MKREELDKIPMVFIVGKGRSGTTLLQSLLDAHPACSFPLESRIIIHLKSRYGKVKKWNETLIRNFYHDLFSDLKFSMLWKVDKSKLLNELLALGDKADFPSLCKIVYLNHISINPKEKIRLIGDKNPIYTVFIPELLRYFPDAKFIHLIRDHRDNIHSHSKVFPVKNITFLAGKWVFYNEQVELLKLRRPDSVLSVRYEDLVADPEKQLKYICDFLGLNYDPAMLGFHEKVADGYKDLEKFVRKFHSNLYNPVNGSKVNEWKRAMRKEDVKKADIIAGRKALEYGYHIENRIPSTISIRTYTRLRVLIWLRIVKTYYRMPLQLRNMVISGFKLVFGKDYKKKKELHMKPDEVTR